MITAKLSARILLCAALVVCAGACQDNPPRFKKGSGKFDEWGSYHGKGFAPAGGKVASVDTAANTITIATAKGSRTFPVLAETRLIHEDSDIPLVQVPVGQPVKYVVSADGKRLISVWYGNRSFAFNRPNSAARAKATKTSL